MVISFRLSRRGRRFYPSTAVDDAPPPAASPAGSPLPLPPPWDAAAARLDSGNAARSGVSDRNGTDPVDLDLEPSFALNLFPDGYSIGEPGKGMLLFLIGDDREKQPYNRASKALLSDIEYGYLPQDILHGMPCKFRNGTIVCEVRDYRSIVSDGGDSLGDDFPKVNRVVLRLGTECVVKDLSSIVDASWTYHDQLIAESVIMNALQPRLNLDPTPCLKRLCSSVVKKIDLGLNKGRQQTRDASLLNISIDPPEKCKPKECDACEGAAVCIDNAALEVLPSVILNSVSVNCPSSLQINNAKSTTRSDPDNTIQYSSAIRNSSALCDRKQSASSTPAPDLLLQTHEQRAQVTILQVDGNNGRSRREAVLPQKGKEPSKFPCERHERQNGRPSNKIARLSSQSLEDQSQNSMETSNKEGLKLGSPKQLPVEVKVNQTIGNKDMRRQQTKDASLLNISTDPPEKCKPKNCDASEGAAVCIDNAALEILPTGIVNSLSVNCPSSLPINKAKSAVVSDPDNSTRCFSTIMNSSALCNRKQSASSTPAPDHLLQNHEQWAQVAVLQVDRKNGPSQRETVLPQKRKEPSNLPCEKHGRQNCRPSNKNTRFSSQSSKGQLQKSMRTSNKEGLTLGSQVKVDQAIGNKGMRIQQEKLLSMVPTNRPHPSFNRNNPCVEKIPVKGKLESPKELPVEVMVDQTVGNKGMRVQQQKPLSMLTTNCPHPSLKRNKPCVEKIPEKVNSLHTRMKERHLFSKLDMDNYGVAELEDSRTTPVTPCSESSTKAVYKPREDKASTELQPTASKRLVSGTSTVLQNQKIHLKEKRQKKADIQTKQPCENRSSEERGVTDGTSSQLGISPDIELCIGHPFYTTEPELCIGHPFYTTEPDIEKILSEVILTTQRHGLNGKAAKIDGLETSRPLSSCSLSQFFPAENAEGSPYMREEIISYYGAGRTKNTRNIRRFIFHCVQYFCRGIVDQSNYILCLLESEEPDDHQIAVETIFGDECIHIATLPTSYHANKFVDQFISLMKQDGYTLCNAAVCNGPSDIGQQFEDVSQLGYLTGQCPQHQMFSPCVAKSIVINESKDIGCAFQKRLLDVHANVLQQGTQQWVLTEQSPSLGSAETLYFLNPSDPGEQPYNSRALQDQGLSLASGVCSSSMDLDQYLSVEPSQEMDMNQYCQCRHDIPRFSDERDATNTSTGSSEQWKQIPTQLDSRMYQFDFPAFGRQISSFPPLPAGRSMLLSALHPAIWQTTVSDDGSVTSTPVHLPVHLDHQCLSRGAC